MSSNIPAARNEPVLSYAPGSAERAALKAELQRLGGTVTEIHAIVGGESVATRHTVSVVAPHKRSQQLGVAHQADQRAVSAAIQAAKRAQREWASWRFEDRAGVFLRAAELLAGPWRQALNAATMPGQSKTAFQAEIDSACEIIDFWRFNVQYARQILTDQPIANSPGIWNRTDHRPLEGFVYAITPFNFTAIAGNLPTAPALMGNTVIWKPSPTQQLAASLTMELLEEAGMPPGVINLLPGDGLAVSEVVLADPHLAGIHFTG